MKSKLRWSALWAVAVVLSGCATGYKIENAAGQATIYNDVRSSGPVAGIGIESQDVVALSEKMARSMLSNSLIAGRSVPPRVQIDESDFINESASIINKRMITRRLENALNNAANGRMRFINREDIAMVEKERELKRSGIVDGGTIGAARATSGVDYKLSGRITSLDSMNDSQMKSRYTMIDFKMTDMETAELIWSGIYEFSKSSQDNVMYR